MQKVIDRVIQAKGLSRPTIRKIKYVEKFLLYPKEDRNGCMTVPSHFIRIIRKCIGELFVVRKYMSLLHRIIEISYSYSVRHNSDSDLTLTYGRSTLNRFMRTNGLEFSPRRSHYSNTRVRWDIAVMREDYLLWLEKYREDRYHIYYQDKT